MLDIKTAQKVRTAIMKDYPFSEQIEISVEEICKIPFIPSVGKSTTNVIAFQYGDVTVLVNLYIDTTYH